LRFSLFALLNVFLKDHFYEGRQHVVGEGHERIELVLSELDLDELSDADFEIAQLAAKPVLGFFDSDSIRSPARA
jgi:hypothetical protein